MTLLNLTTCPY